MRERGSNTARPTEKGVGGLPIRSRPVDFGASIRSISVDFGASIRSVSVDSVDSVVRVVSVDFGRFRLVDSVDFGRFRRDLRTSSWRFGRFGRVEADAEVKAQTQKKPDSSIGESGCSYRKASRALNLPLAPLSNTRASARSVLRGLARRSCIVMITSDRRRIGRCT